MQRWKLEVSVGEFEKRSVVVVEDEGIIAADIRGRLIAEGYEVPGIADSADEAMRLLRTASPDLVLIDIRIKGDEDGILVAQKARDDFDVPVVFLTAHDDAATLQRAAETHPYGYIRKPISGVSLRGSIEIAITNHHLDRLVQKQRDWAMMNFTAVPYAVVLTDVSGRVLWLNSLAEALTGQNPGEAVDRHCSDVIRLFERETGKPVGSIVDGPVSDPAIKTLPPNVVIRSSEGRDIPVEGGVAPAFRETRLEGFVIAFQDVSFASFEEEQAREGAKHSALRRLAEGIVKRLPDMRSVDAAWEAILALDTTPAPGSLRQHVETLHRAVMDSYGVSCHLTALLNSPRLELERVVLNSLLREIVADMRPLAPNLDIQISSDPVPVQAAAGELARCLTVLVRHAVRHVKTGGRLVFDVSHPEMREIRDWVRVRFTYPTAENRETVVERAFEPRWQDSARELHGVYELTRQMGGLVTVRPVGPDSISFEIYLQQAGAVAAGRELPPTGAVARVKADGHAGARASGNATTPLIEAPSRS